MEFRRFLTPVGFEVSFARPVPEKRNNDFIITFLNNAFCMCWLFAFSWSQAMEPPVGFRVSVPRQVPKESNDEHLGLLCFSHEPTHTHTLKGVCASKTF